METSSLQASTHNARASEPGALRAATTLMPRLQAAGALPQVWRGDEWIQAGTATDCAPTGFDTLDQELPGQGWPRGQLVELLVENPGIGELGLLLPALAGAARAGRSCVWVLPCKSGAPHAEAASGTDTRAHTAAQAATAQALPYAPVLVEAGLDLARQIFVKPLTARESCWALEQSLRTAHLGALIGWLPETGNSSDADFRALRRLHLLAQRHRSLVFVLRPSRHARSPSPAALRLQLQHNGGQLQVQILKRRGRPLLEPVALQVHPARWNRAPATQETPVTAAAAPATAALATAALATAAPAKAPTSSVVPSLLQMVQALSPKPGWAMPAALTSAARSSHALASATLSPGAALPTFTGG